MIDQIRETLLHRREYMAELDYITAVLEDKRLDPKKVIQLRKRFAFLQTELARVNSWLSLLSEDEAFVIQRHLIDGIDIPRIVAEYEARWGREFAKSERTIKTYQKNALNHIAEFERRKVRMLTNNESEEDIY